MLKKIIINLLILYIIFINNSTLIFAEEESGTAEQTQTSQQDLQSSEEESDPLNLVAQSAIMIDAETGIILYDKECHERLYPASITKIMTTLLALENSKPTDVITHSHNAVFGIGPGSSHIGMREGEQITMEQALNGIMLASANEVCMAVAEFIDSDVDKFVERMNKKAAELGALDTHFNNPHGFHDDNHYTTAYDMSLFMQEAIKNKDFVKLISTLEYTIPETNIVNEKRPLTNKNKMIQPWSPFYYEYCVGSKTGFTDEAGNTLVTFGEKDGIKLITVVMKDQGTATYTDTKTLLEYGFSLYENKKILSPGDFSKPVKVVQKYNDRSYELGEVNAVLEDSVSVNVPNFVDTSKIKLNENIKDELEPTIKKSDVIGSLDILYDSKKIASADLVSDKTIEAIPDETIEKEIRKEIIIQSFLSALKIALGFVGGLAALIFIALIIKKIFRKKRRRRIFGK